MESIFKLHHPYRHGLRVEAMTKDEHNKAHGGKMKTMKTMIARNIPDETHTGLKIVAATSKRTMNEMLISMIFLAQTIGSPRDQAIDNVEFKIIPHRTDDSQDTPDVWRWKLQTWVDGELTSSAIL